MDHTVTEFRIIQPLNYFALKHDWVCIISIILKELFINSLRIYIATFRLMQCENVDQKDIINKIAQGIVLSHLEVTFEKFKLLSGICKLLGLVENAIFYYKFPDIFQEQNRALFSLDIGKV